MVNEIQNILQASSNQTVIIISNEEKGADAVVKKFFKTQYCPAKEKTSDHHCRNCSMIEKNIFPDVLSVSPDQMFIGEARSIREFANSSPSIGKKKYVYISHVLSWTYEAVTALLKIIEEPPKFLQFLITSSSVQIFPKTILSRSYVYYLFQEKMLDERARKASYFQKFSPSINVPKNIIDNNFLELQRFANASEYKRQLYLQNFLLRYAKKDRMKKKIEFLKSVLAVKIDDVKDLSEKRWMLRMLSELAKISLGLQANINHKSLMMRMVRSYSGSSLS